MALAEANFEKFFQNKKYSNKIFLKIPNIYVYLYIIYACIFIIYACIHIIYACI